MAVSRGEFLKSLGKALPGMALGAGGAAAHKIMARMAPLVVESKRAASEKPPDAPPELIEFVHNGPAEGNKIALTFDDGPTPGVTDRILDELAKRNLHATFFMIGERIAPASELARRVAAEGHEVGNHTFTHAKLTELSDPRVESEIARAQGAMRDVLGYRAAWFRPPFGALRQNQASLVRKAGMRVAMWSVDTCDWSREKGPHWAEKALRETKAGSIIICHEIHEHTANDLGLVLDRLLERGLTFSTLSALVA